MRICLTDLETTWMLDDATGSVLELILFMVKPVPMTFSITSM